MSTGHIRRGSDIDLSVLTDSEEALELHLRKLEWTFETERVSILKLGQIREYLPMHVADVFPIELTVYAVRELRFRPKSSTDGKSIRRVKIAALEAMFMQEHPEAWGEYLADGTIAHLDEVLAEAEDDDAAIPGPFDGQALQAISRGRLASAEHNATRPRHPS